MDEPLQRLLEAEARAQAVIDAARRERDAIVETALAAARDAEARFEAGRAALRAQKMRPSSRSSKAMPALSKRRSNISGVYRLRALAAKAGFSPI